jgi:hypothetical protein
VTSLSAYSGDSVFANFLGFTTTTGVMADGGFSNHYQVLEELGRKSSNLAKHCRAMDADFAPQVAALESSTRVLRKQRGRPSPSNT